VARKWGPEGEEALNAGTSDKFGRVALFADAVVAQQAVVSKWGEESYEPLAKVVSHTVAG
jgi:hypothetical protein